MSSDLTFITNEENQTLKERFEVLIKDTSLFDCLVGYFYSSGFHAIYHSLENTEKIRILIGISTGKQTFELLENANLSASNAPADKPKKQQIDFSHAEAKQEVENLVQKEMEDSEDNRKVEEGVNKFIEWIKNGKLEIKAYPSQNIHAKLYIMTFREGDRDTGRVITGSSNFTQAGLVDNLEFNVELKNRSDYDFAKNKFEELWSRAVDVSEKYVQTIQGKTWLSQNISPYQLYLKFLYEYFKDELSQTDEVFFKYIPQDFKKLEYQEQAVLNARKILLEYGGVFVSDVVGLGKTYISAMLAGQLDGRTLVIAPPVLLEKSNPGSWLNVFSDFRVQADYESLGKLDDLLDRGTDKYTNIIIDEAHRFRTETTITYEKLAEICRGKRVILVTATPYNNTPKDILSLLKLFQKAKKSAIPNLPDLEGFFNGLDKKLKNLDRKKDYNEYISAVRANAREIRDKVLKYLMVRRTRTEIEKYFSKDIKEQGLKFPDVKKPEPLFYELNDEEDDIFNKTIDLIANKFKYARYTPLLPEYYKGKIDQLELQSQRNMGRFMKILLVKRLESSFFAFRNSVDRFLSSYQRFIKELDNGNVYVSKKHTNKIFEFLENDDDEAVQRLIDEGKAERYESKYFRKEFKVDLQHDHDILLEVKRLWQKINRDPKLLKFTDELSKNRVLKENHLIIFTESKETANYLFKNINYKYPDKVLLFTGDSGESVRDKVIENFDARVRHPKEDYRILVSTEVLSEGVNLHRSNVVINYDIPWNPTRMMQRVGRVNRVDTLFDTIHTFNFFPTKQSNDQIKLKEAAEAKINAFLTLLGGDAELLTEGEPIGSHELFNRLTSKKTLEGEEGAEESELKYLQVIRNIREKEPDLFETIKRLPKKARTARVTQASSLSSIQHKQDVCDTINFFNDILELLFYDALRNDRSHDDHYYSRFNCKIPFLNGGLFDPIGNYDWVHTDICLPDSLFSNKNKTKEGDIGDGILDIFDRYNFTVREDEPLEKEVAIDPELLGKAYEKFNAIRPDNFEEYKKALKSGKKGEESKFNKQYGVYYTPREIVHYMCQQSLINYLYTEVTQASSLREEHKQDACVTSSLSLLENIYYDSSEPVAKRRRNLPHWEQGGKAYFVTFRLCDSIPKEAAENIRQERQQWFEKNKITAASEVEKLSRENQIEYYRLFSRRYDELLDNGHGSCALANSDCKKIVEEALNHFNNERYHLDKYVVMPNHVHVIVIPMESWPLEKILHSWKSYTAKEINKLLYREGELWMHESFDHIIRSPEQLERIRKYIVTQASLSACGDAQAGSLSSQQHKQDACDTYNFKRHCIEHSLYGVDIDPGAVEIAKLRLWLSLVVDEDDIKNIKPLPNLDYKVVCGNSLLGVEKNIFNLNSFNELEKLKPLFFNETNPTKKQEYRVKIDDLISKITNGRKEFDFKIYFSEVFHHKGGFDVVIGNPPYVQLQKDGGRLANMFKNCGYKTFERTGDIYSLFYEKGVTLLKNDAVLTYITSNKWMRAGYGKSLRKFFNAYNPRLLIDLGPGIFESATVDTNILIIEKKKNQGQLAGLTLNAEARDADLSDFISENKNILPKMGDDAWFIGNQAEQDLKEKIERIGKQLKEWDVNIYYGIKTGLNEAFIVDTATRDRLVAEDPKSAEILKPILRGRDIKRYGYEWAGLWLIATFPALKINIDDYPAVKKYLLNFGKERLDQAGNRLQDGTTSRKRTGNKWFETQDQIAYYPEFEKEKVVWKRIGSVLRFGFDTNSMYCQDSTCIMTGKKLKYLCAFMNSKLGYQMLYDKAPKTGTGDVIVSVQALEPLLIPPITPSNKGIVEKIERIVEKILSAKKQNPAADTSQPEREIDQLVYKLYGLTPEEIAIVERQR